MGRTAHEIAALSRAGLCTSCGKIAPRTGTTKWGKPFRTCQACADYHRSWKRKRGYWSELRDEIYAHYGGAVCACCGETEKLFLTVDHVNNDGGRQRKEMGSKFVLYNWLKQNNYPAGFQILCYNCNCGRSRNGGVCPHVQRSGGEHGKMVGVQG